MITDRTALIRITNVLRPTPTISSPVGTELLNTLLEGPLREDDDS